MTPIARTAATSGAALDAALLRLSSSLERDLPLLEVDILGSVAHAAGLFRIGLLEGGECAALRDGLFGILADVETGVVKLPEEEDVHMAVEALLAERLGPLAGRLHTGRSRNDQVALDLALYTRESTRLAGLSLLEVIGVLLDLSEEHREALLPGYTHRQRAIPITAGHYLMASAQALLRDLDLLLSVLGQHSLCPLGAGALAGSSLPLDRAYTAALLGFAGPTENSLDTVSSRDAAWDLAYLSARIHLHLSRLSTDLVDFASQEFQLVVLGDAIACGSSMMPHKRNPDVFELSRGRSARALGDLNAVLAIGRGLPLGYQRDLQEDREIVTSLGAHLQGTLSLLAIGLRNIRFDEAAAERALSGDATQATDLAEVLVEAGMPFRQAYRVVGALVAEARRRGEGLSALDRAQLAALLPAGYREFSSSLSTERQEQLLSALSARLSPRACVEARGIAGGPAPSAVGEQIREARQRAARARERLAEVRSVAALRERLRHLAFS